MNKTNMVSMWMGKRIEELPKEELIEAINYLAKELEETRKDRERWKDAADPIKYLMAG